MQIEISLGLKNGGIELLVHGKLDHRFHPGYSHPRPAGRAQIVRFPHAGHRPDRHLPQRGRRRVQRTHLEKRLAKKITIQQLEELLAILKSMFF